MQATGGAGGVTRAGAERIQSERQAQQASAAKQPCGACGGAKPTVAAAQPQAAADEVSLGAGSYLKAKLGAHAPEAVKNIRQFICRKICREREILADGSAGELLPREVNGMHHCGRPWSGARNMLREGCGCDTDDKATYQEAACPRALWGANGALHSSIMVVVVETPKPPVST